jgi:TRAP-type uncharacterized transport system substrate-binding protein
VESAVEKAGEPWTRSPRRFAALLVFVAAGVALCGLAGYCFWQLRRHSPPPLTLGTTPTLRLRSHAARIAWEAERRGLSVSVEDPVPAAEMLERLQARRVDLALLPGGLGDPRLGNVRQVAALEIDPLHLLVRQELFADVSRSLAQLRGKRVRLGVPPSVTTTLAGEILRFVGLRLPSGSGQGDVIPEYLGEPELVERLTRMEASRGDERRRALDELPDAVFTLSPLPSVAAKKLVTVAGYRLVPLPFGEAFAVDRSVATEEGAERPDTLRVSVCSIPAYLYATDPPVPPATCPTLGTRVLLLAHRDTDPRAISQLLDLIHSAPLAGLLQPATEDQQPELEFHAGTYQYRDRNLPVVTTQFLAHMGSAIGGVGAFIGGMVAFYGLLRYLKTSRFEQHFEEIRRIELIARGVESDPDAPGDLNALGRYLEGRLTDLKCRAVADFADGGLKGEGLMQGIVALINDTRNALPRLIAARKQKA